MNRRKWIDGLLIVVAITACLGLGHLSFKPRNVNPTLPADAIGLAAHEPPRSDKWPAARRQYMAVHPDGCAVCGSKVDPQIHHCVPFREDESLELDQANLIWLCGPGHENHHLVVGHAGKYRGWNEHVRGDAAILKQRYERSRVLAKEPSKN